MFKIALQSLLARKLRLVTTALAVILGVAFTAGTLVLTDTMSNIFNNLSASVYQGTDALVRAKAVFNGPNQMGEQRPNIDGSLVPALSHVPGVAAAAGSAFGYARLIGKDGKPIGNPGNGAPTLGGNWGSVPALNPFHLVAGHAPQAPDEVVIDKQSATTGHLKVGDTTTVIANGPPLRVRIAGIVGFGTADNLAGASVVLFTTPVAQRLVAEPGKFSTIGFVADRGVSQQQLVSNLKRALPPGTEALTGAAAIKEQQDQFQKALSIFGKFFLIFAIVALVVGAYIILNTFAITVAQRTRENGLLRALGASRRQVLASVLIEALAVGVIAALLGLAAGVAVAAGLKALLSVLGLSLPAGGLVVNARTVAASLLIGIGVTLIAAISPARKAAKVPPVAAMQEATVGSTGYGSKQRIVVGLSILALGVAALFTGLFGHVSSAFLIVGLGVLLVFLGVSVLGRTIALPLSRVIGAPLPRIKGVTGTLARENTMRNPKRTAASASALMIGVGLIAFISIFASSAKASINATIDRTFAGDFVINSGAGSSGGGVAPALAQRLNALPQVAAASYFLGTPGYDANFAAPHYDTQVFVKKAPGVSTAAALAAVKTVAAQYAPGTTVQDQAAYKAEQTKGINQVLALIYTLLALAIVIALLGIGNTLALSIFERTRELGVMRAVGMTRRQLRGTIRWESVIIALQGTLLGLVVGVFFGWALVLAQKNQGLSVFSVPWLTLIIIILLAGLAGVVAAILPSRRAAKLNVLRAIVTE